MNYFHKPNWNIERKKLIGLGTPLKREYKNRKRKNNESNEHVDTDINKLIANPSD